MKATLILSALTALSAAATTSFARDHVLYSSAYASAQRTISATAPFGNAHPTINIVAPAGSRLTVSDFDLPKYAPQPERLHSPGR
jgi:hypothetical protein